MYKYWPIYYIIIILHYTYYIGTVKVGTKQNR